jgi:nudix-type nucleoside diphosphatase (YffH/AdpP family)
MDYEIISEELVFDDVFKIVRGHIRHDSFHSDRPVEIERLNFERGDSAAVIIYERDTDTVLFTNQFRYPTVKSGSGWLTEIPAGSINDREDPKANIVREVREEIGYHITQVKPIFTFFVSPGASSERIHLYYAEVSSGDRHSEGGGLATEGEDIQMIKIPVSELLDKLQKGEIIDAKSIIGIQWLVDRRKEVGIL